jgi:tellurite resistance protein
MDTHELGGLWLLREMWGFPSGVPEDQRLDYLKAIMACARAGTELTEAEKRWVIGYGAACGAHQATVDALDQYDGDEDVVAILDRNMPVATTWGRVAIFDAIRASAADGDYNEDERAAVRRAAAALGLDEAVVAALESHYQQEQDVRGRRIALVFGDDIPYTDRS